MPVALMGTSPHSEAVLVFAAYGAGGLAVKIRQSTVAQRRPESTLSGHTGPCPWTPQLGGFQTLRRPTLDVGNGPKGEPSGSPMLSGVQHSVGERLSPILAVNRNAALPFYATLDYACAVHIPRSCSQEPLRAAMLAPRSFGDGRDGASLEFGLAPSMTPRRSRICGSAFWKTARFVGGSATSIFLAAIIVPALRTCACLRE